MLTLTDDIITNYERLVYSIVNKYSNESNKEDLFQVGMIGVINASKKYNSNIGVKFTSFAYKYILGEILKYLREDKNIRVSRDILNDYRKICLEKDRIYKEYGRTSNDYEISNNLDISLERINEVYNYNEKEISINTIISDDEKNTLEDIIYRKDNIDKNDLIDLKYALKDLTYNEKKLIYERYFNNRTQTDIAKENNIPQVKVYRLERKILDKLKDKIT